MKKFRFLFFTALAVSALAFITSCKDDEKVTYTEDDFVGEYRGTYSFEGLGAIIDPVTDTVLVTNTTAGDSKVNVYSRILDASFEGTVKDDGSVTIPSFESSEFIVSPMDTAGNETKVTNLKLTGSGSIDGKTAGAKFKFKLTVQTGVIHTTDPDLTIINGKNIGGGIVKVNANMTKQ
jgi:hypothetical protein